MRERRKCHEADHKQCGLHDQRTDIGNEVEDESKHGPSDRIRQTGHPCGHPAANPDRDINQGNNTQIARQIVFDVVHDFERAQPRFALIKEHHQHAAQLRAAEQHEEQCAEKYEGLADRRRHDQECWLHETHDVDSKAAFFVGRQKRAAQLLQCSQRAIKNVQLFLNVAADIRRFADPIHGRRRQENDHAIEYRDHEQPENDR